MDISNTHFILGAFAPNDITRFFLHAIDPGLIGWAVVVSAGNPQGVALVNLEWFFKVKRALPEKRIVALDIPHWDFHWQSSYWLRDPVRLRSGDTVRVTCKYDNRPERQPEVGGQRTKPRYVVWGEGTLDEMCLTIAQVGAI